MLDFRRAHPRWGRTMEARLQAIKNLEQDVLPRLQKARILQIMEGGILLDGYEITSRGVKSKNIETKQTWWCITHQLTGSDFLENHYRPRSSTGFSVEDDDSPY